MRRRRCVEVLLAAVAALGLSLGLWAAPTVVLNEVAWGGTAAGSQDEWIELRNCTSSPIDLEGWVLMIGETRVPLSVVIEGTLEVRRSVLEPNGFLLLERTDDTTVSDVEADILYKGSLSNSGTGLVLIDALGNVVDECDGASGGWPAGCAGEGDLPYGTMERVDPIELGNAWRTNDGIVCCGHDAAGGPLVGTPRGANSATVSYLKAPRVQILAPLPGDLGCPATVQWQAVDPDGLSSGLVISIAVRAVGAEEWAVLAENLANEGAYVWDCAGLARDVAYEVRVTARDPEGRVGTATSAAVTMR